MNRQNIVFALFLGSASIGCATATAPRIDPETVGQLAPSYASIAVAPIHHDAPPELGQVVDTDGSDDASPPPALTVSAAPVEVETPDVATKQALTMGAAR